jgi:HD-GYP domain-containing protein (c-di-GMP phosphodiesterase class II)
MASTITGSMAGRGANTRQGAGPGAGSGPHTITLANGGAGAGTIAVDDLQVGMFIHLDGGWLSHPFPLSSFRIASPEQIATIRGLGLGRVRWSPEKSTHLDAQGAADAGAASDAGSVTGSGTGRGAAPPGAAAPGGCGSAAEAIARRHRERLAAQRETQQLCERQFGEAATAWRDACDALATRPADSRAAAQELAVAMLAKMRVSDDIGIRLVNGAAGDRGAAHALNVTVVSLLLGRLLGLAPDELLDLGLGALMHDLGKADLPERVRHLEPGASANEVNAYRDHVARGIAAGRRMELPAGALAVIAQHHEHADASGFPQRLGGEPIVLSARIVALVNRYDNLCNPPTRVPPLTPHEAVAMLFAQGRARYDATVLNGFIRMMGVYPAGSLVQLTDDRYAIVVGGNTSRPLKPRVLVHDPKVACQDALLLDLEETPDIGIRRSLTAGKLPPASLEYLDPRPRVSYYFEPLARSKGSVSGAVPLAQAA